MSRIDTAIIIDPLNSPVATAAAVEIGVGEAGATAGEEALTTATETGRRATLRQGRVR
jgi:hypothetical protein